MRMKRIIIGMLFVGLLVTTGCSTLAPEKQIRKPLQVDYGITAEPFSQSIGHVLSAPMVEGNDLIELVNGDQIFPAMLAAIRQAEKSTTIEMFVTPLGVACL